MIHILDSNACSDLFEHNSAVAKKVSTVSLEHQIVTSVIVLGEVWFGIERLPAGKRRRQLRQQAETIFAFMRAVLITPSIALGYAILKTQQQTKGKCMAENDLWIAATALDLSATLVTRDGDFATVDSLRVEDWSRG